MLAHCSEFFWGFEIWPNRDSVREKVIKNKLAKARKTRKSPGTLSLKKFGPGKLLVGKVWAQFFSRWTESFQERFIFDFFIIIIIILWPAQGASLHLFVSTSSWHPEPPWAASLATERSLAEMRKKQRGTNLISVNIATGSIATGYITRYLCVI